MCADSFSFAGCLALFVTSLPFATQKSTQILGLALGMVFLGLGTGGVKATISPFIGKFISRLCSVRFSDQASSTRCG